MATKRRLKSIRLDKIAAVDKPCQEHATVALIKRAPGHVPPAIAKKTFEEALAAQLIGEKISDTFWRAFENQWAIRDAFRTALGDELAAGGDGTIAAAGFTAAMQQIATLAADAARTAASSAETDLESAVEEAVSKWLQIKEQPMKYINKAALLTAASSFVFAKATAAEMTDLVTGAVELDAVEELPANQPELIEAAKAKKNPFLADKDKEETKKMRRELDVLKLAPEVKSYFDTLDTAGQDAFLAKSDADRTADIAKAASADPVVYTTASGIDIRKSDGGAALALAKQADADRAELAKLRAENAGSSIEKRAAAYPNVSAATAAAMLKSADAVGIDTEAGKDVIKALGAMNKAQGGIFKTLGTTEGNDAPTDIAKARGDFNAKVAEIQKRDSVGMSDAMSKARTEAPDLFAAAYPEAETEDA